MLKMDRANDWLRLSFFRKSVCQSGWQPAWAERKRNIGRLREGKVRGKINGAKNKKEVADGGQCGREGSGVWPQLEFCLQLYPRLHLMMGGEVSHCGEGWGGLPQAISHAGAATKRQHWQVMQGNYSPPPSDWLWELPRSLSTCGGADWWRQQVKIREEGGRNRNVSPKKSSPFFPQKRWR